jgi:hypothetical protein
MQAAPTQKKNTPQFESVHVLFFVIVLHLGVGVLKDPLTMRLCISCVEGNWGYLQTKSMSSIHSHFLGLFMSNNGACGSYHLSLLRCHNEGPMGFLHILVLH